MKLAERDLVLDVQAEGDQWLRLGPELASAPSPLRIVIDHAGRPPVGDGPRSEAFQALLRLADREGVAVKLSGPMRYSRRPPPYDDVDPFVAAVVRAFGARRLVWGSDWPFLRVDRRVDYAPMLACLGRAIPSAADRRTILSATTARLFGFASG